MPNSFPEDVLSGDRLDLQEGQALVVPVIQEYLATEKALQTTGIVRLAKHVRQYESDVSEPLNTNSVDIERVPKNVIVEEPPPVRTEGDVTIIPVLEEVLVVTKQLRLVEEVRISRRQSTRIHQERVALRSEEVLVERESLSSYQPSDRD